MLPFVIMFVPTSSFEISFHALPFFVFYFDHVHDYVFDFKKLSYELCLISSSLWISMFYIEFQSGASSIFL